MYKPLADEIKPNSIDDVVGQKHILGPKGMLRRIVESGQIPNMIFYGPSGTGKTTVARIIAEKTNRSLRKLNATTAGIADIKQIISELDTLLTPGGCAAQSASWKCVCSPTRRCKGEIWCVPHRLRQENRDRSFAIRMSYC